jgi:multidrug resistance protein, MATE family
MALGAFSSGRGKTRVVMYVDFLLAAVNIGLDPLLIFGLGPFPRLGIVGAALSTDIAYTTAVLAYAVLSFRSADCIAYGFWKHVRFEKELFGRLLRYGLPTGLQMAAELSAFSVFLFLIGRLGTAELAATNLALNINMLSFVPMIGVGTAVMTLVGKRIGEGRPKLAERTTWLAARAVAAYMFGFGILFVVFPEIILLPFTGWHAASEMESIRDQVIVLLRFVAFYTFFDGMAIVFAFAIRGAGDTRFPFVYTLITAWTIMVLPTWLMTTSAHGGIIAAWFACSAYICTLGTGFLIRFLQGKWKTMNIIGGTASDAGEGGTTGPAEAQSTNDEGMTKIRMT